MVVKAATEQGSCFFAGDAFSPNCWWRFMSVKVVRATRSTYQTELDKKSNIKQFGHRNLILCNSLCCHWFQRKQGSAAGGWGEALTHRSVLAELCGEVAFDWPEIPSARVQNSTDVLRSPRAVGVPWNRGSLWLRPSVNLRLQGYTLHSANGIPLCLHYNTAAICYPNTWMFVSWRADRARAPLFATFPTNEKNNGTLFFFILKMWPSDWFVMMPNDRPVLKVKRLHFFSSSSLSFPSAACGLHKQHTRHHVNTVTLTNHCSDAENASGMCLDLIIPVYCGWRPFKPSWAALSSFSSWKSLFHAAEKNH